MKYRVTINMSTRIITYRDWNQQQVDSLKDCLENDMKWIITGANGDTDYILKSNIEYVAFEGEE